MRFAILLLLCGSMLQPAAARRASRRMLNDSLNAEIVRSRQMSLDLQQANRELREIRPELTENRRLLRSAQAENSRLRDRMRSETLQAILITALILFALSGFLLWTLARNFSKNLRVVAQSIEASRPSSSPPAPKPAAVVVKPAEQAAPGDNGRQAEKESAPPPVPEPPAASSTPLQKPPAAQEKAEELPSPPRAVPPPPPQRNERKLFWFTRENPEIGKIGELIELLRQRGIGSIEAGVITRETMQKMERGEYEILLCAYEPRNEQGIMIDKNLQGVLNALVFAGNLTPLIVFLDPKDQQISSWDQHMVNGYDFATVATSRLAFINQVVLSLQSARTAA